MALAFFLQPLPKDYPNRLASPTAESSSSAVRGSVVIGLLVACFVPRVLVAFGVPSITPDGAVYIEQARLLESGNLLAGLRGLSLYPAILAGMHCLGIDWELAAKIWGVVAATLVVLPLYGWVRRQFDDQVALVASFLYIVHPKFIALSPEVIRDQTFWLLFATSLYTQWRAVVELRVSWFLLAALTTTLACLTRFEGLYLFLPMGLWSLWRWIAFRGGRLKLLLGVLTFLIPLPALILAANLVWHQTRGEWLLIRLDPVGRAMAWLAGFLGWLAEDPASQGASIPRLSLAQMAWVFFPIMTRGLSPCFALLMFGGLWKWRRVWARRDHQALFWTAMVFVLSSWIQLWFDRQLCFRYALPIVLMASPFAALGLVSLTQWLVGRLGKWLEPRPTQAIWGGNPLLRLRSIAPVAAWGPIVFVTLASLASVGLGIQASYAPRKDTATLGLWLREQVGSGLLLVGPAGLAPVAAHYADARYESFRRDLGNPDKVVELVQQVQPQLVILEETQGLSGERYDRLKESLRKSGWTLAELPPHVQRRGELSVLLRSDVALDHGGMRSPPAVRVSASDRLGPPRSDAVDEAPVLQTTISR